MVADVFVHAVQVGKYFPVLNEVLREVAEPLLRLLDAVLHHHVLLHPVGLELLEHPGDLGVRHRETGLGTLDHVLQMFDPVPQLHQLFTFGLLLEVLDLLYYLLEQRHHFVCGFGHNCSLVHGQLLVDLPEGIHDLVEEVHGGKLLQEVQGALEYLLGRVVVQGTDFLEQPHIDLHMLLDLDLAGPEVHGPVLLALALIEVCGGVLDGDVEGLLLVADVLQVVGQLLLVAEELVVAL